MGHLPSSRVKPLCELDPFLDRFLPLWQFLNDPQPSQKSGRVGILYLQSRSAIYLHHYGSPARDQTDVYSRKAETCEPLCFSSHLQYLVKIWNLLAYNYLSGVRVTRLGIPVQYCMCNHACRNLNPCRYSSRVQVRFPSGWTSRNPHHCHHW